MLTSRAGKPPSDFQNFVKAISAPLNCQDRLFKPMIRILKIPGIFFLIKDRENGFGKSFSFNEVKINYSVFLVIICILNLLPQQLDQHKVANITPVCKYHL